MVIKENDWTRNLWLLVITNFLAKQWFNICLCCEKQIVTINNNNNKKSLSCSLLAILHYALYNSALYNSEFLWIKHSKCYISGLLIVKILNLLFVKCELPKNAGQIIKELLSDNIIIFIS